MKCLRRNKKKFYYCLFDRKEHIYKDGMDTGNIRVVYKKAVEAYANVSTSGGQTYNTAAYGQKHVEPYGVDLKYSRTISFDDPNFPLDEYSVLFVDKEPEYDADGTPLYDFFVKRISRSLNCCVVAIERAEVT